jgi:predicted anti-sigma-YlaC factor YlaD
MGNNNSTKNDTSINSRFCDEFVEIVQLILDGEASDEHKNRFYEYYMQCGHCISYYNLESSTVEFLKKKIIQEKTPVPKDLEKQIRSKIQYLA